MSKGKQTQNNSSALVIFSGGQDSTTCLFWALNTFKKVETITFNYGQKHSVETEQAKTICKKLKIKNNVFNTDVFKKLSDSNLIKKGDVTKKHSRLKNLPASFVPNRNAVFITFAHALAQKLGCNHLVTGVCQTDYSGYPDCRLEFIESIQRALNLGSEANIEIHTPLMFKNKKQTFELAASLNCLAIVLEYTHTCYNGNRKKRNAWGYGCAKCPACDLRKKGYEEFLENNKK